MPSDDHEETPLLGATRSDHAHADIDANIDAGNGAGTDAHRRRVILASFGLVILVDFAACFLDAPQMSILEEAVCNHYYGSTRGTVSGMGTPVAHDCAVGPVQAELATVNQLLNTFNRLPGLFVAIPFGIIADRYGRRPVLILVLLGAILQDLIAKTVLWRPDLFTPRMVWLSSLAGFVGGGDAVATSMIFLVVADVAPPQQRAQLFFALTACERVGEIVGTPLSTLLMFTWGPWTPYILSSVLIFAAFMILLIFLPETLRPEKLQPLPVSEAEAGAETLAETPTSGTTPPSATSIDSIFSKFRPLVKHNVVAILVAFFVSALGRQSTSFLLQYIRQRFYWTYEKASMLITLRAVVDLVLLLVGLPLLNQLLAGRSVANNNTQSAQAKDLLISRISVALFTLGSLTIAVAPIVSLAALGIVVFTLGSGFSPAARSLATSFCRQDEAGLLYTALALAQTVGGLTAGPLLAISFEWSLNHLGHEWTGIPFALIAGLFAFGLLAMSYVRL